MLNKGVLGLLIKHGINNSDGERKSNDAECGI
jgi:hypothetical protein